MICAGVDLVRSIGDSPSLCARRALTSSLRTGTSATSICSGKNVCVAPFGATAAIGSLPLGGKSAKMSTARKVKGLDPARDAILSLYSCLY
jgi:hypothetical protein